MKVRKVTARGTSIRETELEDENWTGDAYRKIQQERLGKVGKNVIMHLGRGIRTAKAGNIPNPNPRPSTEGMTRITNRGTGSRKSRNIGSKSEATDTSVQLFFPIYNS